MAHQDERQVVVLGDAGAFARQIADQVRAAAYRPVAVEAIRDAVQIARQKSPDLVIVALPLRDSEGAEACEQIRLQSGVPILAISAHASDRECHEALESGADDYVQAPFPQRVLEARIMAAIRRANTA